MEEDNIEEQIDKVVVTDIVGETIAPGNVVAFSRSGRNTKSLQLALVSSVSVKKQGQSYSGRITFFSKYYLTERVQNKNHSCVYCLNSSYYTAENCPYSYEYVKTGQEITANGSYTTITSSQIQDHVMVLKNPCFSLNNPNIADLLEMADLAKDDGYLPKEYNLGDSADADVILIKAKEIRKKKEAEERKKNKKTK